MKVALFAPLLALALITQAHAWTYNCAAQTLSNHSIDSFRISNDESVGAIVWVRYSVDGNGTTIPVMNENGDNDFTSPNGDMDVSIDTLVDADDGTNTINLKIKSLGIKGDLSCTSLDSF